MAVNNITGGSSAAQTQQQQTASTSATSSLANEQMFLKLLMAQMQNQDPLNPTDSTQFVQQLSQFSLVEQAVSQTQQLTSLSQQIGGLANNDASNLVGKTVTLSNGGGTVSFDGVTATQSNVTLGGPAQKVTATVTDSSGNVIRTMDLGSRPAGQLNVVWDGKGDNGETEPSGSYSISVSATAADNSSVSVSQYSTGVVTKVTYDKGYPDVFLDNGADGAVSNLVSVGK